MASCVLLEVPIAGGHHLTIRPYSITGEAAHVWRCPLSNTCAWAVTARVAYALRAPIPGVVTSSLARDPPGVRYKVRKSGPPKAKLRTTSGVWTIPITSPEGATTQIPPEPTHHTRPAVSTLRPSGTPGAAEAISQNTRLFRSVPSGATSKARIRRWEQTSPRASSWKQRSSSRLIATYRMDSLGEKASPLGYSHSSV